MRIQKISVKNTSWETKRKLTPKLQSSTHSNAYLLTYLAANYTHLQALAIVTMSQQNHYRQFLTNITEFNRTSANAAAGRHPVTAKNKSRWKFLWFLSKHVFHKHFHSSGIVHLKSFKKTFTWTDMYARYRWWSKARRI